MKVFNVQRNTLLSRKWIGGIVVIMGLLLICAVIYWSIIAPVDELDRPLPQVLGFGLGFSGSTPVDILEANRMFDSATVTMQDNIRTGNQLMHWELIASWISIVLTSSVTVIAGCQEYLKEDDKGVAVSDEGNASKNIEGAGLGKKRKGKKLNLLMGLVAIMASFLMMIAKRIQSDADSCYKKGDDLYAAIKAVRMDIQSAKNAEEAKKLLQELEYKRLRNE